MDRHRNRLRALYLIPLIASLQVPNALAIPFAARQRSTIEVPDTDCSEQHRLHRPHSRSASTINYISRLHSSSYTSPDWAPTAYEISDGQVQAVYTIYTEAVAVTSSGTTFLSSSTVTSYYSYTQVPRQITSEWTSTSTTTVFVHPSPPSALLSTTTVAGPSSSATVPASAQTSTVGTAFQQSITTSIPDSSLTSLTTSEVQSVTVPIETHTSGVSILPRTNYHLATLHRGGIGRMATMGQAK